MSEELKTLSKDVLAKQVKDSEEFITKAQQEIGKLQAQIQQAIGVAAFAKHLAEKYDVVDGAKELAEVK